MSKQQDSESVKSTEIKNNKNKRSRSRTNGEKRFIAPGVSLPKEFVEYLDKVRGAVPRSVYIRNLIMKDWKRVVRQKNFIDKSNYE